MTTTKYISAVLLLFLATQGVSAQASKQYVSPNSVNEYCNVTPHIPDGRYSKKDLKKEKKLCKIDFYDSSIALCAKTWSTSPATIVYRLDLESTDPSQVTDNYVFERDFCKYGKKAKKYADKKLAKFKQTVNGSGTSATHSTSSLLYYHFSRYFNTHLKVPVSVYREMDKDVHYNRVALKGIELTKNKRTQRMVHAGWQYLIDHLTSYNSKFDLFTGEQNEKIYGVLINGKGDRYSSVFNGTRKRGWGIGQNLDFMETPAFTALRDTKDISSAINTAIKSRSSEFKKYTISFEQMSFWVKEITEIIILDFIFSQQDRIGNIDFKPYWFWTHEDNIYSIKAETKAMPVEIAQFNPLLIMRTRLNDNDAGAKAHYANFTKKAKMLESIRHISPSTYEKLRKLATDLQNEGKYSQFLNHFKLSKKDLHWIKANAKLAFNILQKSCVNNQLKFDIDVADLFRYKKSKNYQIACGESL